MKLRAAVGAALCLASVGLASPAFAAAAAVTQDAEAVLRTRPDGSVEHLQSGFLFPPQLAGLAIVGPKIVGPDDVMARYGAHGPEDGRPWLDLFVYRAEGTLEDEAAEVGQIIVERYGAMPLPQIRPLPGPVADGRSGWYDAPLGDTRMTTGFVLARRGGWSLKVRGSSPAAAGSAGIAELLDAIEAIAWAWTPSRPPGDPDRIIASR